jgi:hypothetical protein
MSATYDYTIRGSSKFGQDSVVTRVLTTMVTLLRRPEFMDELPRDMGVSVHSTVDFFFDAPQKSINITRLFLQMGKHISSVLGSSVEYHEPCFQNGPAKDLFHIKMNYSELDTLACDRTDASKSRFNTSHTPRLPLHAMPAKAHSAADFEKCVALVPITTMLKNSPMFPAVMAMLHTVARPTVLRRYYDRFSVTHSFVNTNTIRVRISQHAHYFDHYTANNRLQEWANQTQGVVSAELILDARHKAYEVLLEFNDHHTTHKPTAPPSLPRSHDSLVQAPPKHKRHYESDYESECESDYASDYTTDQSDYESESDSRPTKRRRPDTPAPIY